MKFSKFFRIVLLAVIIGFTFTLAGCSAENVVVGKIKQRVNQVLDQADLLGIAGAFGLWLRIFLKSKIKNETAAALAEPVLIEVEKKGRDLTLWLLSNGRDGIKDFVNEFDHTKPLKGQVESWFLEEINKIKKIEAEYILKEKGASAEKAVELIEVHAPKVQAPALADKIDPKHIPIPEFRSPEATRLVEELRARTSKQN